MQDHGVAAAAAVAAADLKITKEMSVMTDHALGHPHRPNNCW